MRSDGAFCFGLVAAAAAIERHRLRGCGGCGSSGVATAAAVRRRLSKRQRSQPNLTTHKQPHNNCTTTTHNQTPTNSYNLSIGVGLSKVNGKVFRIGHLGNMDELMMCSALSGAEMAMIDSGMKIKPGSGVGAAIDYWQKTAKVIPTREF